MDMDVMFTPVIGELVRTLVGKGASAIEDNEQVTTLRMLLRECLRREVRFNRELLSENQLDLSVRIYKLETEVLEYVCAQAVPLEKLFNKELDSYRMRFFAGENASHRMCSSSYKIGHETGLSFGGSGSSVGLIMQPAFDVASGDTGLSVS